jgi:hypothetical protein
VTAYDHPEEQVKLVGKTDDVRRTALGARRQPRTGRHLPRRFTNEYDLFGNQPGVIGEPGRSRGEAMRADLRVGATFPDLELPDHNGRPIRLSEIAGQFPLVVTFYRGWW